jgi:hypothetical protein
MSIKYKTFTKLDFKTRYFIRVRAKYRDKVSPWLEPPIEYTTMKRTDVPAPTGVSLNFDRKEKNRHNPIRCIVTCDEVKTPCGDDVDYYVFQLWRWDPVTWSLLDTEPVQKAKVEAKDEDANTTVKAIFTGIRQKGWYVARARAVSNRHRSKWSAFSSPGSASDSEPPPTPLNVTIHDKATNRIVIDWDAPLDDNDSEQISPDIAYFQIQLSTSSAFSSIYKFDRYHIGTSKSWKVRKSDLDETFYARVRSVDGSGNKSSWVPATVIGNSSPNATPDGVTIGRSKVVHTFTIAGNAEVKNYKPRTRAEEDLTILKVTGDFDDVPTGSNLIIDILVAGSSIFSSQANMLHITAGGDGRGSTNAIANPTILEGQSIRVSVVQVGSIQPGGNGTIRIVCRSKE